MTDTTETTTSEQQADDEQSKSQRVKTTREFFREKFADEEETESFWIDPKGDSDELSKQCFVAGQIGVGKSTQTVGLLDDYLRETDGDVSFIDPKEDGGNGRATQ